MTKISQLARLETLNRALELPLALYGENRNITLGQILDAVDKAIVPFNSVGQAPANTIIADTSAASLIGSVVYDTDNERFYLSVKSGIEGAGFTTTYYTSWVGSEDYFDKNGKIRKDCLFLANDGSLYFHNGTTLKSAGITEGQLTQLRHATPIEVESEAAMEQLIVSGEYEDGQMYFIAEE